MLKENPEMKNNYPDKSGSIDRRSLVKNGTALIGAGFPGLICCQPAETREKAGTNIFNVRDFGATGNSD